MTDSSSIAETGFFSSNVSSGRGITYVGNISLVDSGTTSDGLELLDFVCTLLTKEDNDRMTNN